MDELKRLFEESLAQIEAEAKEQPVDPAVQKAAIEELQRQLSNVARQD